MTKLTAFLNILSLCCASQSFPGQTVVKEVKWTKIITQYFIKEDAALLTVFSQFAFVFVFTLDIFKSYTRHSYLH